MQNALPGVFNPYAVTLPAGTLKTPMNNARNHPENVPQSQQPPSPPHNPKPGMKNFIVQCEGFRCMAYKDAQGVWRSVRSDEPLPKVLRVVSEV
jgi:hypothetical protein